MTRQGIVVPLLALALVAAGAAGTAAQSDPPPEPSFSLSSSEATTTKERAEIWLTFRRLQSLDFRVYKVRDPLAFFAGLEDLHQIGTDEPLPVPQEPTLIERISSWKSRQRSWIRGYFRGQVTIGYREARRAATDTTRVSQRVTLQVSTFAQVPLLNPDQLVTSWRELLPNYRDAELRRLPLDLPEPGVYVVEAVHDRLRAYTVVIRSDLGVVAKASPGQVLLFAADRFTGEPRTGCDVTVLAGGTSLATGRTTADGVLDVSLPAESRPAASAVVRCGDHVAVTDPGSWAFEGEARELTAFIYTDKPIYRPGHTVHAKAILRWRQSDALAAFDAREAEIVVSDPNDTVLSRQRVAVDEFGSASIDVPLGAGAALGMYSIAVNVGESRASAGFEVQEYRKPEFEVLVTTSQRFIVQGGEALADVSARYYFGQPVAGGVVKYVVERQPYFSPLRFSDDADPDESGGYYGGDLRDEGTVTLDAQGRGRIAVPLTEDENGRDYRVRIEARVADASGREVSGAGAVVATFGDFLVATRLDSYMVRPGGTSSVSIRTVDYLGAARPAVPVKVYVERLTYPDGYYNAPTVTSISDASSTTDAQGRGSATVNVPTVPGSYRVRVVASAGSREVQDDTWFFVPGALDTTQDNDAYLELVADKRAYTPGDTAHVMVRGENVTGPVLLTKEGQHVTWYRLVRPTAPGAFDVPITEGDVGDIYVHVTYLRAGRLFRAERRVSVPATDRALTVTLTPDRPVAKPQEPGSFSVQVTKASGEPVKASVSLAVIDEAVYGVKADDTPDPLRVFYRREYSRVGTAFSRDYHFTGFSGADRLRLASRRRRPFSLADFKADRMTQPQVRKDFPDAIYWVADLVTDAQGRGRIAVTYPDSLTTWRLTARAVTTDTLVGQSVARTTTTKDLIVRLVTPRFLTEGDAVTTPTVVHNYLDDARETKVDVTAKGLTATGNTTPVSAPIASAGERRDVWTYSAAVPGTATLTATATTPSDRDAVDLSLPIVPFGVKREAAAVGSLAAGTETAQTLTVPATANAAGRTIRVSLAPSIAGSLLGATDFLTSFPYGCTEQTLSSFVPNLVVTRTLTDLGLAPTERLSVLGRQVTDGLKRLYDLQHDDGGWGWWKSDGNHPFMTAYALSGLVDAQANGYRVDEGRRFNALRALAGMYLDYPRAEPELKVYMVWALGRALGERTEIELFEEGRQRTYTHRAALDDVWSARDRMSPYGHALLTLALDGAKDPRAAEAAQRLAAAARSEGALTHWQSDTDPLLFDAVETSVEATAWAVRALAARTPDSPLLEPAVRWLILNRRGGFWGTTKQTAMALTGVLDYMRARKDTGAVGAADVYVNGTRVATQTFTRESLTQSTPITIDAPANGGANAVRVVWGGSGTLHWSASAEYFDPAAAAYRQGSRDLAITRSYARLVSTKAKGRIVYREEPIAGPVQPGDVISVRLAVAGGGDWRYLLLEDPIPAGTEALPNREAYPLEQPARWARLSQQEFRDQRSAFFIESLDRGRADVLYLLKVVSEGTFRAVPARVVPMYVPDVHASSEAFTLTVAPAPAGASR